MDIPPPEEVAKKQEKKTRVVPVKPPKYEYDFTCKRCGSHLFTNHPLYVAKFSGVGLGYKRARVCRICGAAEKIIF